MEEKFMRRAIELSRLHMKAGHGGPFGAIIVKDGRVIGEGWNCVTTMNDPTAHAEITAIRRACEALDAFDLEGAELYSSCEPCPMCLAAAYWARIGRVYYASTRTDAAQHQFDDEHIYKELALDHDERTIPMKQLLRDEAYSVFREWDLKIDKVLY
jgi:tRNA(Arg) A34 adenosine deaminase TadA